MEQPPVVSGDEHRLHGRPGAEREPCDEAVPGAFLGRSERPGAALDVAAGEEQDRAASAQVRDGLTARREVLPARRAAVVREVEPEKMAPGLRRTREHVPDHDLQIAPTRLEKRRDGRAVRDAERMVRDEQRGARRAHPGSPSAVGPDFEPERGDDVRPEAPGVDVTSAERADAPRQPAPAEQRLEPPDDPAVAGGELGRCVREQRERVERHAHLIASLADASASGRGARRSARRTDHGIVRVSRYGRGMSSLIDASVVHARDVRIKIR